MRRLRPEDFPTWLAVVIVVVIVAVEVLIEFGTQSSPNTGTVFTISLAVIAVGVVALISRRRS